jgi:hypothetical protein
MLEKLEGIWVMIEHRSGKLKAAFKLLAGIFQVDR